MSGESPSQAIDAMFAGLDDWRGAILSGLRTMIKEADPEVVEDLKWKKPTNPAGVPVWSDQGMICTGEVYQDHVKVTFARGALLDDPDGLFNASLEGNVRRAVDIREGDEVDGAAFKALVREAVRLNKAEGRRR
jgi:hypothetical protein